MNESPVMTKKEVAAYFKVDERTVDVWTKQGILMRCKMPAVRYNRQEIEKLARVEQTPYSPLERRRAKQELEEKELEIKKLKEQLQRYQEIFLKINAFVAEVNLEQIKNKLS